MENAESSGVFRRVRLRLGRWQSGFSLPAIAPSLLLASGESATSNPWVTCSGLVLERTQA